jgi:hypothetical protein
MYGQFWNVVLEKISQTMRNEVLHRGKDRNIQHTIRRRKDNWVDHMRTALFWVISYCHFRTTFLDSWSLKIGLIGCPEMSIKITTICCVITQKSTVLIYFMVEAWNHAWVHHMLCRNCLLEQVTEGKIEVMERKGRWCKQLLSDLKEMRGYWKLKKEALDLWRPHFGRGHEPVTEQTMEWMKTRWITLKKECTWI